MSKRLCPICNSPASSSHNPFCSARCKDADLYKWLTNSYAIPAEEEALPDEDLEED